MTLQKKQDGLKGCQGVVCDHNTNSSNYKEKTRLKENKMVYNTIGIITMILMAVLAIASAAPTNTTSKLTYCDQKGSTSMPVVNDKSLDKLYDDLDNTLDILRRLCLDYSKELVSWIQ